MSCVLAPGGRRQAGVSAWGSFVLDFLELCGLQVVRSMPVHHTITLRQGNFHQPAAAGATRTLAGARQIGGPVGGAQQPMARVVKKTVGW